MRVTVVTPPPPVVSKTEAKDHLRVRHSAEDTLIEGMVAAATAHIDGPDGWLGRSIGVQTLEARLDAFPWDLRLPFGPVRSITSVKYIGSDSVEETYDPALYENQGQRVALLGNFIWPATAYRSEAVRVRYVAGYETIPPAIRAAILLMVGDLYRNRDTVSAVQAVSIPMSTTVDRLLSPFRVFT